MQQMYRTQEVCYALTCLLVKREVYEKTFIGVAHQNIRSSEKALTAASVQKTDLNETFVTFAAVSDFIVDMCPCNTEQQGSCIQPRCSPLLLLCITVIPLPSGVHFAAHLLWPSGRVGSKQNQGQLNKTSQRAPVPPATP